MSDVIYTLMSFFRQFVEVALISVPFVTAVFMLICLFGAPLTKKRVIAAVLFLLAIAATIFAVYISGIDEVTAALESDKGGIDGLSDSAVIFDWLFIYFASIGLEIIAYQVITYFFINKPRRRESLPFNLALLIMVAVEFFLCFIAADSHDFLIPHTLAFLLSLLIITVEIIYLISSLLHKKHEKPARSARAQKAIALTALILAVVMTFIISYDWFMSDLPDEGMSYIIRQLQFIFLGGCVLLLELIAYQVLSYFFIDGSSPAEYRDYVLALLITAVIGIAVSPTYILLFPAVCVILAVEAAYLISWIRHRKKDSFLTLQNNPQ
ncbi:MAG: hypothetical protein LUH54_03180 [Firmicutes bacterium]|nr:hypothetical protein [Bacillota bacterium]